MDGPNSRSANAEHSTCHPGRPGPQRDSHSGSPGSDRITTAVLQGALNIIDLGLPLQAAVDHPRLHVKLTDEGPLVRFEDGLPVEELDVVSRCVGKRVMYFGAVEAAMWRPGSGLEVAADGRRAGGTAIAGTP